MNDEVSKNEILEAISVFADATEKRFEHIDTKIASVQTDVKSVQTQLDKVTVAVVNLGEWKTTTDEHLTRLEEAAEKTYKRLDDFIHKLDINNAEVAAVRSAYARMDERVRILETKLAHTS